MLVVLLSLLAGALGSHIGGALAGLPVIATVLTVATGLSQQANPT